MTTPIIPTNIHFEKDSLGIGQAVEAVSTSVNKLVDTISSAIGIVYEPTRIKRLADAETYKIKVLANAQIEAESLGNTELATRIDEVSRMVVAKELRRQDNIAYIVNEAIKQIELKEQVSDEEVDPDWTTRFINIAQDISNEEMKNLWAQILAGEVAKPRTYSLRTLECLKNMTKDEATLFVKFASLALQSSNDFFVYRDSELLSKYEITYPDIQRLVEIGLLNPAGNVIRKCEAKEFHLIYNQKLAFISFKNKKQYILPVYDFTSSGNQILSIVTKKYNDKYFIDVLTEIKKKVDSVKYYIITSISGDSINYINESIVEL